jgi:hypothetical protein
VSISPPIAVAMAEAVLAGDLAAALGLSDWLREEGPPGQEPLRLYVYDNGGSYSDHCVDFIVAPASLPEEDVRRVLLMDEDDARIVLVALAWKGGEGQELLCDWLLRHWQALGRAWDGLAVPRPIAAGLLPLLEGQRGRYRSYANHSYIALLDPLLASCRLAAGLTPAPPAPDTPQDGSQAAERGAEVVGHEVPPGQ